MNHKQRFASKTKPGPDGCIIWVGGITADGYGRFYFDNQSASAHRWAYITQVGPIPDGLEIDHLCRVRACVNVEHLEPVTAQVNSTRGVGFAGLNARKTHCHRGHEFTSANTRRTSDGHRVCRACDVIKSRIYKARRSERSAA